MYFLIPCIGGVCPFRQLPILEFDGIVLAQSMSILRYLARKYGLYYLIVSGVKYSRKFQKW